MIHTKWDINFKIGHKCIDFEHQIFLNLIKKASRVPASQHKNETHRLLLEIKKYAEFHFFSEENLMIEVNYPEYENHKEIHAMLKSNLDRKIRDFGYGKTTLDEIVNFLFEWFALHTTTLDKKIAAYLNMPESGSGSNHAC